MKRAHVAKNIENRPLKLKDLEDKNGKIDATLCGGDSAGLSEADEQRYFEALGFKYHEPGICQPPEFGPICPNWKRGRFKVLHIVPDTVPSGDIIGPHCRKKYSRYERNHFKHDFTHYYRVDV